MSMKDKTTSQSSSLLSYFLPDLTDLTGNPRPHLLSKALFYCSGKTHENNRSKHHVIQVGDAMEVLVDYTLASDRLIEPSQNSMDA